MRNNDSNEDMKLSDSILLMLSVGGLWIGGFGALVLAFDSTQDIVIRLLVGWFVASVVVFNMFKNSGHSSDLYRKNEQIEDLNNRLERKSKS